MLYTILFFYRTKSNQSRRLSSVIELNRTHKKVPVRLCSIAEPIELQSNDWVRLGSIGFGFGFVRLATPGKEHDLRDGYFVPDKHARISSEQRVINITQSSHSIKIGKSDLIDVDCNDQSVKIDDTHRFVYRFILISPISSIYIGRYICSSVHSMMKIDCMPKVDLLTIESQFSESRRIKKKSESLSFPAYYFFKGLKNDKYTSGECT